MGIYRKKPVKSISTNYLWLLSCRNSKKSDHHMVNYSLYPFYGYKHLLQHQKNLTQYEIHYHG